MTHHIRASTLLKGADKLGVKGLQLTLKPAGPKLWQSPLDGLAKRVEDAVLDHWLADGWRGSSAEGGLILNLIKAMSFAALPNHYRGTFVEAIYFQNVQPQFKVTVADLLAQVQLCDLSAIRKNVEFLCSKHEVIEDWGGGTTFASTTCTLDFFPTLQPWMFDGLLETAGPEVMLKIAKKFSEDSYEYRRGWPDITVFRNAHLKLIEVKAPGDRIQPSQKKIIEEFVKPLNLDYTLVEVIALN